MLNLLKKTLMVLATTCLSVNVVVILGGVISRYILNSSPIWVDELARYLLISSIMLMAGVLVNTGEHLRLSLIDKINSQKISFAVNLYRQLVVMIVSGLFFYVSYNYALSIENFKTIGLGISKSIPLFTLPIGFLVISIYSSVSLIICVKTRKT